MAATPVSLGRAVRAAKDQITQHPDTKTPTAQTTASNSSARQLPSAEHTWGRKLEAQPCREQLLGRISLQTKKWGLFS